MIRFGLAVPQRLAAAETLDVGAVVEVARRAEDLDYHSLWVGDGLATPSTMEAWTLLSFTAAVTTSVSLGISVLVLPWRNPVVLAQAAATLDHLSGGRVILGVGIGDRRPEDAAFGVGRDRPALFEEQIRLIKRCWEDGEGDWEGEVWRFAGVGVGPKPLQKPALPIWFGGEGTASLERAARMGDGWMGRGSSTAETFVRAVTALRRDLERVGDPDKPFALSKRVFAHVVLDGRVDRVTEQFAAWSADVYGDAGLVPRCAVVGDPDACVAGLAPFVEHGLDLVLLDPIFDIPEQARLLSERVLPAFG